MDESVRGLMTSDEVLSRLEGGECELDLNVEKWDRIAQWILAELPISKQDCDARTCASCWLHLHNICETCPYYLYFGRPCDADGHWSDFIEKKDFDTAIAMRDALKEIKENTNYGC